MSGEILAEDDDGDTCLPSTPSLACAYAVLSTAQPTHGALSSGLCDIGWDEHIDRIRDNAEQTHKSSVSAADEALLSSQMACEKLRRARIQRDYALAVIVVFLRVRHRASFSVEKHHVRSPLRNQKRHWCAAPSTQACRVICACVARITAPRFACATSVAACVCVCHRRDLLAGDQWSELLARFAKDVFLKGGSSQQLTTHMNKCQTIVKFSIRAGVDVHAMLVQCGMHTGISTLTNQLYTWAQTAGNTCEVLQAAVHNVRSLVAPARCCVPYPCQERTSHHCVPDPFAAVCVHVPSSLLCWPSRMMRCPRCSSGKLCFLTHLRLP